MCHGPGVRGREANPDSEVWDPLDSLGLREEVRDLGRDIQVRDLRSQVRDHRVRTHLGRARGGVRTHTGRTRP